MIFLVCISFSYFILLVYLISSSHYCILLFHFITFFTSIPYLILLSNSVTLFHYIISLFCFIALFDFII